MVQESRSKRRRFIVARSVENVRGRGGWHEEYAVGSDLDANAGEGSGGGAGRYILGETCCGNVPWTRTALFRGFLWERRFRMRSWESPLEMGTTDGPALLG
jgi:hypothetical protein